ncbi:CBL-interacting serine/threonine-protein kinase 21 [Impatiens glandulifera]|uniref:CBL-interacting serine/threonine-protein kinase 21 n=1 Tax=Impatiens glandulifera TaxID=253017 RepID=UPI001FB10ADA|nr:CBL-interacting serine/threonine-protein kinase 21 [Impatiens glandulifera]
MGLESNIGKYRLGRTIGEGTFARVKLALNTENGQHVAIKVINKQMVMENNLVHQVQREIRTMKLLHHPYIVRIHEVIGTKTKIYIVMEYISGGLLSDKLSYAKRLSEDEARKYFQQLIDAIDYCHCNGVFHRDLKPQNFLLDSKGNLKVSDFGLSALTKPGNLLSTACGSPCYVAPELLTGKGYEGAPADVWSCGVILFEMLAGYLPFDESNLMNLYKKIYRADYTYPEWFTEGQKKLISKILDQNPQKRITTAEIIEDPWFQINYKPTTRIEWDESINLDDVHAAFGQMKERNETEKEKPHSTFMNAFQLIALSHDLDLSGLFEQDNEKQKITIGSKHTKTDTIQKIEAAAEGVRLSVQRMNETKVKMHPKQTMSRCSRSCFNLLAQVFEVAPTHCVVEVSKSAGDLGLYNEFCKSLSSMLTEESDEISETQQPDMDTDNCTIVNKSECFHQKDDKKSCDEVILPAESLPLSSLSLSNDSKRPLKV